VDLLLDTHAFIWWTAVDSRLVESARAAIADSANRVIVSAASIWEISVKRASGKLTFPDDTLRVLTRTGFDTLDVTPSHAEAAGSLPLHHTDPFDRMLIAQAKVEGFVLVSMDRQLLPYGVPAIGTN
jgi:PIN domain nuclease of toxin-antitoxin system